MLLGKSCSKQYNIKNTKQLKIGTLFEYRKTENSEIADLHEGRLRFTIRFDGDVQIERKWFNTLFSGAIQISEQGEENAFIHPGWYCIEAQKLNLLNVGGKIIARDTVVNITRESVNSFIFCMSLIRRTSDCVGMFKGYDDYWYLSEHRAVFFGATIGNTLLAAIKEEHKKGNFIISKDAPIDKLRISMTAGKINYMDRETHVTNTSIISLDEYMQKIDNMAYTKPSSPFETEREYRFQYSIISNENKLYPPLVDSFVINAENLIHLIF